MHQIYLILLKGKEVVSNLLELACKKKSLGAPFLSFRFKVAMRHCSLEDLKMLLLALTLSCSVLGVVPPVVVAYFIALSC